VTALDADTLKGYIPPSYGHYIENTGNTTLKYLEMLNTGAQSELVKSLETYSYVSDVYQDISLSQWLALTPPQLVKDHLGVSDDTIAHFQKTKQYVV
jgi:oxalate decarboxylase/phosphoglucose isomerase-like protein (cupin superfamily)